MKAAQDLIPWQVTDISIRPYEGLWSFNPSIHFDGFSWICVLRCCDYAMPDGRTIRSPKAGPGHQTKNAMVIFDPTTWKPVKIFKMREEDDHPRVASANIGFEDMRLFRSDKGGLQGIAASLHLKRSSKGRTEGSAQHQPPEQVLLSFDENYNIVDARPVRGDGFSSTAQKNWVPVDDCAEPRFLYSIGRGSMFNDQGPVHGDAAVIRPSARARLPLSTPPPVEPTSQEQEARARQEREERERREREEREQREREESARQERERAQAKQPDRRISAMLRGRGSEVRPVRGGRVVIDAATSRPSSVRQVGNRSGTINRGESSRSLGTGRALPPKYEGLRGGTQLVRVADDTWLGIGHEMRFEKGLKYYWHTFYTVDSRGKMTAASEQMKLAPEGIEFAAGMAIDGDRVVVSFGVDDMHCRLGETRLSAVLGILRPVSG